MNDAPAKETIYIDAEDDITAIIDKAESARAGIVALVLPKRSSALQSIVNMRLLKKSAEAASKQLVLITEDAALLPLAGAAGLRVAKNLRSRPELPIAPTEAGGAAVDKLDYTLPVGELAVRHAQDTAEVVNLDDDQTEPAAKAEAAGAAKPPKDRGLKVPNFDRFRLLLVGGIGGGILLIIGLILALTVLPKAHVVIQTTSLPVGGSLNATADANAKTLDEANAIIPASLQTQKKSQTQSVNASGQQNQGDKASGSLTITNCSSSATSIPAGTTVTASGSAYVTQSAVPLGAPPPGQCPNSGSHIGSTNISAANPGAQYNLPAGKSFAVAGYSSSVSGSNNQALSGGTDKNVTVVTQGDVDGATAKMAGGDATAQSDWQKQLAASGLYVFGSTVTTSSPSVTASPNVGQAATSTTVTREVTLSALTVKKADLNKFIADGLNKQIDTKRQKLSTADLIGASQLQVISSSANTNASINITVNTTAVPIIDEDSLKKQLTGKKQGEVRTIVSALPGVKSVSASYSPFWVSKAPKPSKIFISQQQVTNQP